MSNQFAIFSGTSHPALAQQIAESLGVSLGKLSIQTFPDGETGVEILENVRGKDIFIVQSMAKHPNHFLMELLIIADALRRASAKTLVAVIPYYGYARQDRKDKGRVPITARLVADLLEAVGIGRLLAMDLHTDQIQGFFNIPVDHLSARSVLIEQVKKLSLHQPIVVSPDVGSSKLGRRFALELGYDLAIAFKKRIDANRVIDEALIGDVKGRDVIIVDDICSTGITLEAAAKLCKEGGAKNIIAMVTHGPLAMKELKDCIIEKFFFTNTVPFEGKKEKFSFISVAPLFARAIHCLLTNQSFSSLQAYRE